MTESIEDILKGFQFYNPFSTLLYTKEIEKEEVVFLELHPSSACNQACVWCRYKGMSEGNTLTKERLFNLFDKYPNVVGCRISGGGEPLMNKHLPAFIKECNNRGIKTSLETNASLFTDKIIDIIGKSCQYCRISLDAATKETYKMTHGRDNFEKVIANIERLASTDLPELGLSYLVTRHNVWEIPELVHLKLKNHKFILQPSYYHFKPLIEGIDPEIREIGVKKIKELISKFQEVGLDIPVKYDRIIQDYHYNRKIPCEITKIIRVIGGDGKEYVCCEHAYEPDFEVSKWNGSTEKCTQCRYNPRNEAISMWRRNVFTKEFQ